MESTDNIINVELENCNDTNLQFTLPNSLNWHSVSAINEIAEHIMINRSQCGVAK